MTSMLSAFPSKRNGTAIQNSSRRHGLWTTQTGDAYAIRSNSNDGTANGDAYGRGDLWFLTYSASELDDSAVRTNTQANIDAFASNQKLNNTDVVVWYGAHINHNRGMFNRYHDHSISGPLVAGPDLSPLRW